MTLQWTMNSGQDTTTMDQVPTMCLHSSVQDYPRQCSVWDWGWFWLSLLMLGLAGSFGFENFHPLINPLSATGDEVDSISPLFQKYSYSHRRCLFPKLFSNNRHRFSAECLNTVGLKLPLHYDWVGWVLGSPWDLHLLHLLPAPTTPDQSLSIYWMTCHFYRILAS